MTTAPMRVEPGRWAPGVRVLAAGLGAAGLLMAGLGGSMPARASAARAGAVVTFAQSSGAQPDYIFPLQSGEWFTYANDQQFGWLMYRPLYWFDQNGSNGVNYRISLADPPVFSNRDRTVTITLKPYLWSDGVPITTRDVEFWMNLLRANKANWGDYVPSQFPDNIRSIAWISARRFSITFNRAYNTTWLLYNELSQIWPIPQHAWDKTSTAGAIGNRDRSASGAVAVWNYLNSQSKNGGTYDTNPLWQVVDGPWRIEPNNGYVPATHYVALIPNRRYSGPNRPTIAKLELVPFTNDTAEFDALRSGQLDYGFLPIPDLSQLSYFTQRGYHVVPWYLFGWNFIPLNFRNGPAGHIFAQLYLRQALEHLMDQHSWVRNILKGYGYPEYSALPTRIPNRFEDAFVQTDHYPFSVSAARRLLRAHGWKVVPNGTDTCVNPGSGVGRCGPGVARGAALTFSVQYSAGVLPVEQEAESFKSAAAGAGIQLTLISQPTDTIFAEFFSCTKFGGAGCGWQIQFQRLADDYSYYPDYYPTGGANYGTRAVFNGEGYSNPVMNHLIQVTHDVQGRGPYHTYENFVATQLPTLWPANGPYQISVISPHLHVNLPQGSHTEIYPEQWTWSG
ncbi:MAG TPA: ABC transporter substrate-binding protein [Verrucomicrobiae bacterium]|nr:ABC transporter substrate-binding protein [Verrucomicrobiae bacterium]